MPEAPVRAPERGESAGAQSDRAAAFAGASRRQALRAAAGTLTGAGCENPLLDAELLLCEALELSRSRLLLEPDAPLDRREACMFEALLRRRAAREPVAYILGRKEFRRISVAVDRRALIPRPETELLVEVGGGLRRGARVADVGTGSGAVALALKDERPDLSIVGIDRSEQALAVARANAKRLGLQVSFVKADLLDGGDYDAALANLPYVAEGTELQPEIALYEPRQALFAGSDGLQEIRRLVCKLPRGITLAALEVGPEQAGNVAALLAEVGFARIERLRDLAGHERVVLGRR